MNTRKNDSERSTKRQKLDTESSKDPIRRPPIRPPIRPPTRDRDPTDLSNLIIFFPHNDNDDDDSCNSGKKVPKKKPFVQKKDPLCQNPLCDHKTFEEDPTPPTVISIVKIQNIDDLITMGKAYHCKKQTVHGGINLRLMNNLVVPLTELNQMVGMKEVKCRIVDQILFFLQGFNTTERCNECTDCCYKLPCVQNRSEMLHTVITGPPGVGKTCLARIIGKVYKAMGILSNGDFHEVARADLIAKYLGQTAIKTQEVIDNCAGGVMFIDEAYSLGHKENRDSFAKECLDTLNKNLSDKRDFLCIIAGYKNELEDCFFSTNPGLTRRFTFRYDVSEYEYNELTEIFLGKVAKENWSVDSELKNLSDLFKKYKEYFPYSGGDIETLFLQCKISHSRRIPTSQKVLSSADMEEGFKLFIENRKYNESKGKKRTHHCAMYT